MDYSKFISKLNEQLTDKHVKMAIGVANDKRYRSGNMTGAVKTIEKIKPGLSAHPKVKAALQQANEEYIQENGLDEGDLKGGQKNLDKNKNGKLDKKDFEILRKEETEQIDEKSDQARRNKTYKNLIATAKGARLNRDSGLGMKPGDTGHKNARDMNKALGRHAIRGEFEEGYYEKPASAYRRKGDEIGGGSHAPVAPVPDRKYIKGTPENKAAKEAMKSRTGHPTYDASKKKTNEEVEQIDELDKSTLKSYINKNIKSGRADDGGKGDTGLYRATNKVAGKLQTGTLDKKVKTLGNTSSNAHKNPYEYDASRSELKNRGIHHFAGRRTRTEELNMEEVDQIEEATVKTQKYSWGTMKTIHHGSDFSIPLHPEHHQAIAKLKDDEKHNFKDETGRRWNAHRRGDDVHFQRASGGNSTQVKHSTMSEETELEEGLKMKLAGLALSALAAHGAHARVNGDEDPNVNRLTGKPHAAQIQKADDNDTAKTPAKTGFNKDYLKSVVDGTHPRPLISKEKAAEHLKTMGESKFGPAVNVDKVNAAGQEPHEEKWEPAKKVKKIKKESFDNEGNIVKSKISFSDFLAINEIKMADLPSRSVKGRSYGADYEDPEGAFETKDDMNKPDSKKAGRKVGQKVGARANLGNSKLHQA